MKDYDQNPPMKNNKRQISKPTFRTDNKLYIVMYNIRTLSSYSRLLELTEAISHIKYNIIALSETRRIGTKIEEYEYCILCHVGDTKRKYGVG